MAEGGLCFEGFLSLIGPISAERAVVGSTQALLRGQGLGRLRVGSTLMGLVTSRRALLRRAWLAARELCFGLGRPQAGCASKGIFCRRFTKLGWQQESSVSRGPFAEFLRSTKRLLSNLRVKFYVREFVAALIASQNCGIVV